jgi:hypothetical protein
MKRGFTLPVLALGLLATLLLTPAPAAARPAQHLAGGGTAAISQVAMNVAFDGAGGASGSFECLMAGRSAFVLGDFNLSHIMAVHATPTRGDTSASIASFSGPAKLVMDNGTHLSVHVVVTVDVATQNFRLQVVEIGTMPWEHLLTGHVSLG